VHLNHKVVGFVEYPDGVELKFADRSSAQGDLLVGADGLKSVIRRQIVGNAPPTYTGDSVWRVTVPFDRIPRDLLLDEVMSVFMGPGGHAVCYYRRRALEFRRHCRGPGLRGILDAQVPLGKPQGRL
jgi:salicylate hydroxylase